MSPMWLQCYSHHCCWQRRTDLLHMAVPAHDFCRGHGPHQVEALVFCHNATQCSGIRAEESVNSEQESGNSAEESEKGGHQPTNIQTIVIPAKREL